MDFEEINSAMDKQAKEADMSFDNIFTKESMLPVEKIRKKMKGEISAQLILILLFIAAAFILPMERLSRSVYIIFMTITCLMTLGYLYRMAKFMKKSRQMSGNTRDVLHSILADLRITIEVYKTGIIAGSLLLPISGAALSLGSKGKDELFEKWFLLELSSSEMVMAIAGYLFCVFLVVWTTQMWADHMYGEEIRQIEEQLAAFSNEKGTA